MATLELSSVSKRYPQSNFQLGPIDLLMKPGTSLALFGKNGAGKSTLFQLMTGHLRTDSGQIKIFDQVMKIDSFALKRRIGYLPQNLELPRWVSAYDLVTYALKLYEIEPLAQHRDRVLAYWDCTSFAYKPLAACSYGMQKRIGLALACLHDPQLLIMDEPFSGLDLYHIRSLEELLAARRGEQLTIISTHVAAYAAKLSDRAAILQDGKLKELSTWPQEDFVHRIQLMEAQFFTTPTKVQI
ncbi:MAG: ABC transporter ATP-binding protein [Proteobacteria bacterium]|nr:ABC transporter ATP-binding protein [Pseudomonadota bacterium]